MNMQVAALPDGYRDTVEVVADMAGSLQEEGRPGSRWNGRQDALMTMVQ
ncbi:hypothetical protein [Streptomyces yanii]|uniref:Uncharacterized protein n=1 Tax=Streptomyces yanii TaxID=78510 RepID=A0ABV5R736_9ACTN